MAFNPIFTPYQPQTLIVPNANGTGGWKNIGAGLKIAGGIGSWLDAKDRAKRINEAQENWYNTLSDYMDNVNPKAPAYTDEQLANYSDYLQNKKENEELINSLPSETDIEKEDSIEQTKDVSKEILSNLISKYRTNPKAMTRNEKEYLQMLLGNGLAVDGIIGPKTIAAINAWENL